MSAALTRAAFGVAAAPVRIVHLGLGAFHRSHQAWYTAAVDHGGEWGIASFTGRSAIAAEPLREQGGLYTLVVRSSEADTVGVIGSISEVWDGARVDRLTELLASSQTAIVTLTITEGGYRLLADGTPDPSDPIVRADISALESGATDPVSPLARLVLGLARRRDAGAGAIAIVPCDNMPGNGALVARGVAELAAHLDSDLPEWIARTVSFVSTSVDRITPRTTDADRETVARLSGWDDRSPVVAEPFSDWVLCGEFPAGRPAWEHAGARFVDDIEPFERRKLWLLNGAHSLLAYAGLARGHRTVADAIGDPACREWVDALWREAVMHLPSDLGAAEYCADLLQRFGNHRIDHELSQVALESVSKLRYRIVPVALAERAAGRSASACARAIAAWVSLVVRGQLPGVVPHEVARAAQLPLVDRARALVSLLDESLAADAGFVAEVAAAVADFSSGMSSTGVLFRP